MVMEYIAATELSSWEVIVAKIISLLVASGVAYIMYYIKGKAKQNEHASIAVLMLDDRVQLMVEDLQDSLKEKMKDGHLSKKELAELKKEAVELVRRQAKGFGVDVIEEFAPKMFPTLIDLVLKKTLEAKVKNSIRL